MLYSLFFLFNLCNLIILLYEIRRLTVKLGFLQNFDFPNMNIMQRIDSSTCLLDVLTNAVWNSEITQNKVFRPELKSHRIKYLDQTILNYYFNTCSMSQNHSEVFVLCITECVTMFKYTFNLTVCLQLLSGH